MWDEILIHSQTSTVLPLKKFVDGYVISSHTYWACDYMNLSIMELKLVH